MHFPRSPAAFQLYIYGDGVGFAGAVVGFYRELYLERGGSRPFPLHDFSRLDQGYKNALTIPFSEKEIWEVIRKSSNDKAPGQTVWRIATIVGRWLRVADHVSQDEVRRWISIWLHTFDPD